MKKTRILNSQRNRRTRATRAKIFGAPEAPRLSVFRSNRFIYAQLINDKTGSTLASASSRELPKESRKKSKTEQAALVGALIAEKAKKLGIHKAIFDRRWYRYHGRVGAVAEGARKDGLAI